MRTGKYIGTVKHLKGEYALVQKVSSKKIKVQFNTIGLCLNPELPALTEESCANSLAHNWHEFDRKEFYYEPKYRTRK